MPSERVLPNKRRKRASKGKLIRVSDSVIDYLQRKRQGTGSWDKTLRRVFGLPKRNGDPQTLVEGWVEVNSGRFFLEEAEANGAAVREAVKRKTKKVDKPIKMREVV